LARGGNTPEEHQQMSRPSDTIRSAKIIAATGIMATVVSSGLSVGSILWSIHHTETTDREKEILHGSRQALLDGLTAIDMFYMNTPLHGLPRPEGRKWDLQSARDAMNRMYVYCRDPQRTVAAFLYAIGTHNPIFEEPQDFSPDRVNAFRREVARELGFSLSDVDDEHAWLAGLHGAE
jgi:hypothetical protein